ncbi:hypothetical protein C8J56DRAFT_1071520 [Mycena floridula]|nr:hypothetical protein C8J56DRAFT_1071520 [Mycena floridula]
MASTEPDIFDSPPVPITHAQRHPRLPLQPIANLNLGCNVAHDKQTQLNEKLLQFMANQDKKLEVLTLAEGATLEHCWTLLQTTLKLKYKESVQNTFVSLKALELNADHAPGDKLKLKDIQAAVAADTSMQEATETEKEKVKELLAEKHLEKAVGACATHSGESKDMAAFSRKMGVEFFNLHQCTEAIGFGFLTREKLNMGMWDMQQSFKSWAIAASSAGPSKGPSNMNNRKKACATIILSNLVYITHSKDIQMSYTNYDCNMIITHKVHLISWLTHVPFSTPSMLICSGDVHSLLEALETGSCHWEKVTKKQLDAAKGHVELKPPKKRREQSDVRGTHVKRKAKQKAVEVEHDDDEEDAGQSKHQQTSKGQSLAPVFSSPEHVTSDDNDDATVNGGED